MHARAVLDAPVPAGALFAWVSELDRYPAWLDIVGSATRRAGDEPAAWDVVLQARLGPLRRTKRLRMERTGFEVDRWVRFERREQDGRRHAAWTLEARVAPIEHGSHLVMELHYDGALWSPPLEHLLEREIDRGGERLAALAGRRA